MIRRRLYIIDMIDFWPSVSQDSFDWDILDLRQLLPHQSCQLAPNPPPRHDFLYPAAMTWKRDTVRSAILSSLATHMGINTLIVLSRHAYGSLSIPYQSVVYVLVL